jgi:hypothetical protein
MTRLRPALQIAAAVLCLSPAAQAGEVSCTASAGLPKHVAATSTTGVERTGSYDVRITTGNESAIVVTVSPRPATDAGDATKVPAPVDKVLLRSPYKSEAIAQPVSFARGATPESAVATFNRSAVGALPLGDVNVIVQTKDGERLCRISRKERDRLAGGR